MSSDLVECYSGQTFAERPLALYWDGERLKITEILSRWRTPGDIHFIVRIGDGRIFYLAYNETEDLWSVELR
jgi:hypothetical protein